MAYKTQKILLVALMFGSLFGFASHTKAACNPKDGYCLLAPLPLGNQNDSLPYGNDLSLYLNGLVKLIIGLASVLAVVAIMIGGFQYVTAATVNGKNNGRETITNALIGLGLAISCYLILNSLNPDLLNFNLTSLKPLSDQGTTTQPPTGGTPDGSTGGTDPTGGTGGTDPTGGSTPTCANCAPVPSDFSQKPPGTDPNTSGCASPGPCALNEDLIAELESLQSIFSGFTINEMYPPTVPHISTCHDNGTCVDVSLSDKSDANILAFLKAVSGSGFTSFVYEACGSRLTQLKSDPILQKYWGNMQCYSTTTSGAESAHLNMY